MTRRCPDAELALKKLLSHIKSVYQIPQKIKRLSDRRKRRSIALYNVVISVFVFFLLQYESFHTIYSAPESMEKRLKHVIKGRIPKVDAVRGMLRKTAPEEVSRINEDVIERVKKDRTLRSGAIGGYITAAVDGVELFSSTRKSCPDCLKRKKQDGKTTEYFHRSVVCASVGGSPHVIYGQEMLKPRDGAGKDEGELTGGKRLIKRLYQQHGHFADVIVADALYLNAPFLNTVTACKMDAVIRLKDEKRLIFQDAEGMFRQGIGKKPGFQAKGKGNKTISVEVWDLPDFEITGCPKKLRVLKFRETVSGQKTEIREMRLVTTLALASPQTLWKMMHKRWEIEENAFHQLKTYYHAKHCYCHSAVEVVFLLMILAFNMRELYLYGRSKDFNKRNITRKSVTRIFRDQLLTEDFKKALYDDSG